MRLKGSVGQGGTNNAGDVMYIQILLSDWLVVQGRPPIAVDGKAGPQTVAAIKAFQAANTGMADGLVETARATIAALELSHIKTVATSATLHPQMLALPKYGIRPRKPPPSPEKMWNAYLDALRGS